MQQGEVDMHPWTSAMAALFIDPMKLSQGSLLGVSNSGAHTYSGTYRRTDSCQPTTTQVFVWSRVIPEQQLMLNLLQATSITLARQHLMLTGKSMETLIAAQYL